jgi:YD repeat-containing protein
MKKKFIISALVLPGVFCFHHGLFAQGADDPMGVTGVYNGNVNSAGSYDPYTGNATRQIDDIFIPATIGKYPLKFTRYFNSRWGFMSSGQASPRGAYANGLGDCYCWNYSYNFLNFGGNGYGAPDGRLVGGNAVGTQEMSGPMGTTDGGYIVWGNYTIGGQTYTYATQLVDPYGQITNITYDAQNRMSRVTEPGGRYLQINYNNTTGGSYRTSLITSVQAFDGPRGNLLQWVNYTYAQWTDAYGTVWTVLSHVDYSDGSAANYTYKIQGTYPPGSTTAVIVPILLSCDDVRPVGAMRKITYQYDNPGSSASAGAIGSEKNSDTGAVVSQVQYPNDVQSGAQPRTEVRGDGATRTFNYHAPNNLNPQPASGKLLNYTDFLGNSTILNYDESVTSPSSGLIMSVVDANNHTTTYTRAPSWAVHQITHPDNTYVSQTYTDESNPVYLHSRTDERGNTTTFTRDPNNRIMRICPGSA